MRLSIRQRGVTLEAEETRAISRRIQFAVARFAREFTAIHLTLLDVNGPRGGVDKVVRLRALPVAGPPLIIEESGANVMATVASVADRLRRGITRALDKRRPALSWAGAR